MQDVTSQKWRSSDPLWASERGREWGRYAIIEREIDGAVGRYENRGGGEACSNRRPFNRTCFASTVIMWWDCPSFTGSDGPERELDRQDREDIVYINILLSADRTTAQGRRKYIFCGSKVKITIWLTFLSTAIYSLKKDLSLLKVSKSRKQIMVSSILPKNERNLLSWVEKMLKILSIVCFLWRIEDTINCFRDLLTFIRPNYSNGVWALFIPTPPQTVLLMAMLI